MRARVLLCAAILLTPSATARAQASPYLPSDHPAYGYVDALIERGELTSLWRLERPYRIEELRAALRADSGIARSHVVASWRDALEATLERAWPSPPRSSDDRPGTILSGEVFVTAQSSAQRELMLADTIGGTYPGFGGTGILFTDRVLFLGRLAFDRRLRVDPDFAGKKDRALTGRNVEGYASGEWQHGELFFGRTGRSWGPPRLLGLQLGDAPYGYEHLYARLESNHVRFSSLMAKLDDRQYANDSVASRYFVAHRLALRIPGVEIAGTETMLFGGVGRGFEFAYANPLSVYDITQYNESQQGNINVGLEASARIGRWGVIAAQAMLDDVQVDECGPLCEEPPSYGVTVTLDGIRFWSEQKLFGSYTRLTNLAYRTPAQFETYDFLGVGLGRTFTDYEELRVGTELAVVPGIVLRAYAARRRQGEGNFHTSFPTPDRYADTPTFLAGTVMTVTRLGATARGAIGRFVGIDADVGLNQTRNAGHRVGRSDSSLEGRLTVHFVPQTIAW